MKKKTDMKYYFTFLLLLLSNICYCFAAINELQALLKLKSSLIGPNNNPSLEDWKPNSDHCTFSGVYCDENSRVVSLNVSFLTLSSNSISIPPEIGLFENLVNLTMTNNNFTGNLPVEMANLINLKVLNISNNVMLNGNFPGKIVSAMEKLQVLDVYNNNFSGLLPVEVAKLKDLRHLHFGGNWFTGEIPETYSELGNLENFGLNGNELTGRLPASFSRLKKLQYMYIGYFNSYDGGIPPEFGLMTSLIRLDIANSNLYGEIPSSLSLLKNLDTLFLHTNHLTGIIPPELGSMVSLKSLDLSLNELTGEIPETFVNLKKITLINLFENHLRGPIPGFIGDYPDLEVLKLFGNNFTLELPENLGRNGKLLEIDLTSNHLTGLIPRDLCKGGRLKTLIIMDNYFIGPIPEELGLCKSLSKFRVTKNYLNGTVPAGLFNLPKLEMIEVTDNFFTGELPSEILSGGGLGQLLASNNMMTGRIPASLSNLPNLQILELEMNRFSGEIPEEIFSLKNLSKLNLSANYLTGKIPASVSHCVSLTLIDFSRNHLEGHIFGEIAKLNILGVLNVSHNELTGSIPEEIKSMTSLTTLDLSYNDFSGRIPTGGLFSVFKNTTFTGNSKLCLPYPAPCSSLPRAKPFSSNTSKIIITVITFITVISLIVLTTYWLKKKRLMKSRAWKLTAFQRLDFKAEDVFECLKEENIIGKGGAGTVYRGSMPDGLDVAIKRLVVSRGSGRSDHGFSAEIQTLGQIKHRNIVRLLGYVSNKDSNLLLYEYMPNGSLGELLHGAKGGHLQWETRYKIAVESARGLCYLHHDCSPLIIHRDVKSNNILLDSDFEAHVADFGLAKFLQDSGASECMSSIAGSYGYIAPEYAYTLKVDEKSDVYSFGVVLLELVAGRKPVGEFGEGVDIVRWVRKTISELSQPSDAAAVMAVVDPRLNGYPLTGVIHLFKVAMMCVEDESSARPTMREVVHMLTNPSPPSLVAL